MAGRRRSDRALRDKLRSPGRPSVAWQEHRRRFWALVAEGLSSEDAAMAVGVSQPVGFRWFREAGGMAPSHLSRSSKPPSGRYLSFAEREEMALWRAQDLGVREIARRLGRAPSTVSRELRRNAATRGGNLDYRATTAQWHAERAARRRKAARLTTNPELRSYVENRLAGAVAAPGGVAVPGPTVTWKGRRSGRRQDRRWGMAWSPQQISERLLLDHPGDETMRISHEAIYQALYVQGRGALKRELTQRLRTGRALRVPRSRAGGRGKSFVSPEILISERPAEAEDRAVPGHWEGDLIIGLDRSAIGTLVERTTRFAMLLHLPPMEGHLTGPRASAGRTRCCGGARRDHLHDHHLARATPPLADLGPRGGNGAARTIAGRHGPAGVFLRSTQPVATWFEREHEWAAQAVLPEGYRSGCPQRGGSGRRGCNAQQQAPEDTGVEDACRGTRRSAAVSSGWRCDDRLRPSWLPRSL
jgi:IS30 family transposase